jgi:hypothetical protein
LPPATGATADPHAGLDMPTMAAGANLIPTPTAPAGFAFEIPAGWQQQPGSAMRVASFRVPGNGVRDADISVFALGGPAGGELANVNRWRGQLGLEPLGAAEAEKSVEPLDAPGGKANLVDMTGTDRKTGQPARMIGVIVPRGGQTWFFKLLGNAQVVGREKAALQKFIQSTRFPDA